MARLMHVADSNYPDFKDMGTSSYHRVLVTLTINVGTTVNVGLEDIIVWNIS